MNDICRACGKVIKVDDRGILNNHNLCQSCKDEFDLIESRIVSEGNSKYLRHCLFCGRPFEAYSYFTYNTGKCVKRLTKKKYCDLHYSKCINCGKGIPFKSNSSFVPVTCSKECRNEVQLNTFKSTCKARYGVDYPAQSEEIRNKFKSTCVERYGVDNPFKADEVKAKVKQTCVERYGVDHPFKNKEIRDKCTQTIIDRYGTDNIWDVDEIKTKKEKTCIERYGSKNPMSSDEVKKKLQLTNIERYGVPYATQSNFIKDKIKQTCMERYGVEHATQNEEIKEKQRQSFRNKYGVDYPWMLSEIHQKAMNSQIEKYGGIGMASDELSAKVKQTCVERYGVENFNNAPDSIIKKKETWLKNYGVDHPMKSEKIKEKVKWKRIENFAKTIENDEARQNYLEFHNDPINYIISHFDHKPPIIEISETLGNLDPTSVSSHIPIKYHNLLGHYQSTMEREITNFLKELDSNIDIVIHDRKCISPYELDIYLPEYNFAIECNPTCSHNSTINVFDPKSEPLPKDYHKLKSIRCIKEGIQLFHIFGYDWSTRRHVINSMIRNVLHKQLYRCFARKLNIREISNNDCIEFLNINHLQRGLSAPIRLGLFSDNELLSVMTFNKVRHTIGSINDSQDSNIWELSRFCNKLNYSVVGGASKLFKYFITNYNPNKIISFSDIAHTKGALYEKLGFEQNSITEPSYVWVNLDSDAWYNRVACQKRYLPKLFNEPDLDIENKTETMILSEHNFVQVFDSGKIKWIWESR